ncbi:MAG: hypothetical protein RIQ89_857 [Bacteroidota bacterium]|jgi:cell division protein FtsI (penicillin-binding protein 3)
MHLILFTSTKPQQSNKMGSQTNDKKQLVFKKIYFIFFMILTFALCIVGRIIYLQTVEGDKWRAELAKVKTTIQTIEASRGNILADNGELLSTSVPIYDIFMDPGIASLEKSVFNDSVGALADSLSSLFDDKTSVAYEKLIRDARIQQNRYCLLFKGASYAQMKRLRKFPIFERGRYKGGLIIEQRNRRELPFKLLAQRTIGTMRNVKPVGIEAAFNNDLKGVGGQRIMQRMPGNVYIPIDQESQIEPKDGNDIYTTIDINIQDVAENALMKQLQLHDADHGCAILMEVATGQIKAIANLSRTAKGIYEEDFNYAIAEAAEPGSTMKTASMLALFEKHQVSTYDTVFVGNGTKIFGTQTMRDVHAPKRSKLSIREVFENSSNVGISTLITNYFRKNAQQFMDALHSYKLNHPLTLQISGAGKSRIKNTTDKDWHHIVSLPWISVGYEVAITPLQMLTFYNAIANNGKMVKPMFVKEIKNHGQLVKSFNPEVMDSSIASQAAIDSVKLLLEAVVLNGSARTLKSSKYKIAGKTGTAQIAKPRYGYDKSHMSYQASFVGYFPAKDPKYSCAVIINGPSEGVYLAGVIAAPVFQEISDKVYANHLEMHPDIEGEFADHKSVTWPSARKATQSELKKVYQSIAMPLQTSASDADVVAVVDKNGKPIAQKISVTKGTMPDVRGMTASDAIFLLENNGLQVSITGKGAVQQQSIEPGTKLSKGRTILLVLG